MGYKMAKDSYLQEFNAAKNVFLHEQPWVLEGINQSSKIFIN